MQLDYKTDSTLRSELKKYTKDATVMIVAQRIGTILNADKIVVLDNGKCVGIGTHKELMKKCKVYKRDCFYHRYQRRNLKMSSNEKRENSHSRGHGPMRVSEKPKDFMGSIKKLMKSLSSFKVLIFIALVLAALSSILSLVAPNKLSDLTDEITKGITINTSNMKELEEDSY